MKRYFITALLFYYSFIFLSPLYADIIYLKNGRTMEGKILKRTEHGILLKIPGGTIELDNSEIKKIKGQSLPDEKLLSPKEIYLKNKNTINKTDAEAHFKLGSYCTQHELFDDAIYEFKITLELNNAYKEKVSPYLKLIKKRNAIELLNKAIDQNNYREYDFALDTLLYLKETYPVFFKENALQDFETIIKKNIIAGTVSKSQKPKDLLKNLFKYETDNFVIFSDTAGVEKKAGNYIEQLRDQVVTRLGFSFLGNWKIKCHLYIYDNYKNFLEKSNAPKWAAGWQKIFFKITKEIVNNEIIISTQIDKRLIIAQNMEESQLKNVLLHEMAHLIYLGFIQGKPIPLWFNEGIAVYAQQSTILNKRQILSDFQENVSYPLTQLLHIKEYPNNQSAFYRQSSSIVHFIITACNTFNFIKLTKQIQSGVQFYDAFFDIYRGYFQNDLELETKWINYLNKQNKE